MEFVQDLVQEKQGAEQEDSSLDLFGVAVLLVLGMCACIYVVAGFGATTTIHHGLGGMGRHSSQVQVINREVSISLLQAYTGHNASFNPGQRQIICHSCGGSGGYGAASCSQCRGAGVENVKHQVAPGFFQTYRQKCKRCRGEGRTVRSRCSACGGARTQLSTDNLHVLVPAGAVDGQGIRLPGLGHQVPDVGRGDIIVRVRVRGGSRLRREGDDLHTTVAITLKEALLGFATHVVHLNGRKVPISRTGSTLPGTVIELLGEGMPVQGRVGGFGRLLVAFNIKFPPRLSNEVKDGIRELF